MKKQAKPQDNGQTKMVLWFTLGLIAALAIAGVFAWRLAAPRTTQQVALPTADANGVQVVNMRINGLDYEPSTIPIRMGQKVRWNIDASRAQGCARTMYSRTLGINQGLQPGINTIEFTPQQAGIIPFSCTMGMARGQFQVVSA